MSATYFRQRAIRARQMAEFGEDLRLTRMLLELAGEFDAEADLIEAEALGNSVEAVSMMEA